MIQQVNRIQSALAARKPSTRKLDRAPHVSNEVDTIWPDIAENPAALIGAPHTSGENLTDEERRELRESEETIRHGARAWLEMGTALRRLHERRLYRETHENFEAYCWATFHLERSVAYQLMSAAKRYELALPFANKLKIQFTNESQLRSLSGCQAVDLPEVLKLAARKIQPDGEGNRIPTAKILAAAVQQVKGRNVGSAKAKESNREPVEPTEPRRDARAVATTDPAEAVRMLPDYSDDALLTLARAIAAELSTRGLIKSLNNL